MGQLFAVTGDYGAAHDAVQEAFIRAINSPKRFVALDNQEAWLLRVAVNVARSRWRRLRRGEALLRLGRTTPPGSSDSWGLSGDRVAVVAALRELPAAQRECLAMHYLLDLSIAEIAGMIGVPT